MILVPPNPVALLLVPSKFSAVPVFAPRKNGPRSGRLYAERRSIFTAWRYSPQPPRLVLDEQLGRERRRL